VVANPADGVSLARIVNTPTRGIGDAGLDPAEHFAAVNGISLLEALRRPSEIGGISARAAAGMGKFVALIDGWTGAGTFLGEEVSGSLAELVERVIEESGLRAMYTRQAEISKSETDAERLDNLDELISSAREFEISFDPAADPASASLDTVPPLLALLRAYLESVSLVADADAVDPTQGAVTLMTLHAAKGLEFEAVAMIGLEQGCLPHSRSFESEAALEEERRLCFVGITRAMQRLMLTSAKYRTLRGISERTIPSRFLEELDAAHVSVTDMAGALAVDGDETRELETRRVEYEDRTPRTATYPKGALVRHPQFGIGEILSCSGGDSARAQIKFKDVGVKTLVLAYARLQRLK
jgi:DNA helicase-2/ATP-dependent DNA helicase PcrA